MCHLKISQKIGAEEIEKLLEFGGTWRTSGEIFRSVTAVGFVDIARGTGDHFYFSWISEADAHARGFAENVRRARHAGIFHAG